MFRISALDAIKHGNLEELQARLAGEPDLKSFLSVHGGVLLLTAAEHGHVNIVEYLCSEGADKDACTMDGKTALFSAAQYGHLDVVKYLIKIEADIHKPTVNFSR